MRILYHHRTLGDGAEGIHVSEMVNAFRSLGHEVVVVGPAGETTGHTGRKGQLLAKIKKWLPSALFELAEIAYNIYGFLCLARIFVSFKPDFIYDRYILFNGSSIIAGRFFNKPVILEVNAPLALERKMQADEKLFFEKTTFFAEKWICSNATKVIVVSTPLADYLRSIDVPGDRIITMPNGVNRMKFPLKSKHFGLMEDLGINTEDIVIGFSGIFRPWHGLELLIKAFANLVKKGANVFLLIVGDGPIRNDIEKIINDTGINAHCRITGRVPHCDVNEYINLFDIAVCPKSTFYASPMKLIEYMALAKAVVVPNMPNFIDIVSQETDAMMFIPDNIDSLEATISMLCTNNSLRHRLGKNARSKVMEKLNWEWNAEEVCKLAASSRLN